MTWIKIRPDNLRSALAVALFGKLVLLLLLLVEHGVPVNGPWYFRNGDVEGYIGPIESLLRGDGYQPDHRMPGYGAPYLLLRLLMGQGASLQMMVLLQLFASSLAVVLIAHLGSLLSNDPRVFRWTFWLALASTYASLYDREIRPESFAVLALVGAAQQAVLHFRTGSRTNVLLSGCALTWLIFMKPVYLPLLALLGLAIVLHKGAALRSRLLAVVVLGIPWLVVDGAWCLRNALKHGEFRPLTDGMLYPDLRVSIRHPLLRLMQAYGTSFIWWDPSAEIRWFNIRQEENGQAQFPDRQPPLPDYVYTDACPRDSLRAIADDVARYNKTTDEGQREQLLAKVNADCDRCIASFRTEHPFHYHVTARLRMLKTFLLHSGTSTLMGRPMAQLDPVRIIVRASYSFLYLASFLLGSLWALRSLVHRGSSPGSRLCAALVLYGITIFPFGVRMTESRYSTTIYLLALLLAILLVADTWTRIRHLRRRPTS